MSSWVSHTAKKVGGLATVEKGPALSIGHDHFSQTFSTPSQVQNPQTAGPYSYSTVEAMYYRIPQFQRAVAIIGGLLSTTPLKYRLMKGVEEEILHSQSGDMTKTLEWVNDAMSKSQLFELYAKSMILTNSFCAVIDKTPTRFKEYGGFSEYSLLPLATKFVTPVYGSKGLEYIAYNDPDAKDDLILFKAATVLYVRGMNPFEMYLPSVNVGSVAPSARIYEMIKQGIVNNSANPSTFSGIVSSPGAINDQQRARLKRELNNSVLGMGDTFRLLLLENEMKYTNINTINEDKYMEQTKSFVTEEFYAALQIYERLVKGSGDGKELEFLLYMQMVHTILPMVTAFCSEYTKKMSPFQKGAVVEPDITRIDILQKFRLDVTRQQVALAAVGGLSANDIREANGYPRWGAEWDAFCDTPARFIASLMGGGGGEGEASPSLSLPGSEGGRDQSDSGEAEMIDETGSR